MNNTPINPQAINEALNAGRTYLTMTTKATARPEIAAALSLFTQKTAGMSKGEKDLILENLRFFSFRIQTPITSIKEALETEKFTQNPAKQTIKIDSATDYTSIHITDTYLDANFNYTWTLQGLTDETLRLLYDKIGRILK